MAQPQLFDDPRTGQLRLIHEALLTRFGVPERQEHLDPLSQMVLSFLGSKTKGPVSRAAYDRLLSGFGSWQAVRDATQAEIEAAIAPVTHADSKAINLKACLTEITHRVGTVSIAPLSRMNTDNAITWLMSLPGVGPKIAAATSNTSTLVRPVMVIDTHHLRILKRLRIVSARSTIATAYDEVMSIVPAEWDAEDMDQHHLLMKLLGQNVCHHHGGSCRRCPLLNSCPTGLN